MTPIERAKQIRAQLDTVTESMPDGQALQSTALFREWSGEGVKYTAGQRLTYEGILYRVLQNHTSQPDWNPDRAVSLFAKVLIPSEDVIPDWQQPDSTNPYMRGDRVRYNGKIYESLINNNVWNPSEYPAGWKEI